MVGENLLGSQSFLRNKLKTIKLPDEENGTAKMSYKNKIKLKPLAANNTFLTGGMTSISKFGHKEK